jgi:anaerobic nitric oxide reductase flavorubredoxin
MQQIANNIYWTGIKDWELRQFHGHELSTHRGSTYNAYLIRDDEKTVLVDTVWSPYKEMFVERLDREVGLKNIDAIVINHIEPDHGGSLGLLMEKIPGTPIYCTVKGAEIIRKHFHQEWNFVTVKTGDTLKTGEYELAFVEMQMIHWPDSMLTYIKGAGVVLSNDAFGQHYSPKSLFNDEVDHCELYQEALKYYANILTPFSALIKNKIAQIAAMNLDIKMIAPSHGVIWRKDPMQIVAQYAKWADSYQEDFVVITYDTMYDATKAMAEAIAEGLTKAGVESKLFNTTTSDLNDLATDIFKAKGLIAGSCTVNNTVLHATAALLDKCKGLKFKNKCGAAFGSYGWSGEAPKFINAGLETAGFKIVHEPFAVTWRPDDETLEKCKAFGEEFAKNMAQ